jgi:hypothetical protein
LQLLILCNQAAFFLSGERVTIWPYHVSKVDTWSW